VVDRVEAGSQCARLRDIANGKLHGGAQLRFRASFITHQSAHAMTLTEQPVCDQEPGAACSTDDKDAVVQGVCSGLAAA
jgi:hypothetical protein